MASSVAAALGRRAGKVRVALCQLAVTADKASNLTAARRAVEDAAGRGAELVVLPEMWNCPYSNESFPVYAEDMVGGESPSMALLAELAAEARVTLVGGSVPERDAGRLYNTCCVFGTDGRLLGKHRKTHLFDIDIPGKITFRESDTLTPGESGTVVATEAGVLGIGICYDLRFAELAMLYAAQGAQMLIYPGAFNMTTGPVHWELLQKARAVDNQLFVAACSIARDPAASYVAWGHSTIVGPFAEVVARADAGPAVVVADLDFDEIDARRANMPLQQQRRTDLYQGTWDGKGATG